MEIKLHKDKTKIVSLSNGIDFVGFRNFYYFRLLRERNVKDMQRKIRLFKEGEINKEKFYRIFQSWAYAR